MQPHASTVMQASPLIKVEHVPNVEPVITAPKEVHAQVAPQGVTLQAAVL